MQPIRYACPSWCTASDHDRIGAYIDDLSEPVHSRSMGRSAHGGGSLPAHVSAFVDVAVQGADSEPGSHQINVYGNLEALSAGQAEQLAAMLARAARTLRRIDAGDEPEDDSDGAQVLTLPTAQTASHALMDLWRRDMTVQGLSPRTITERCKTVQNVGRACGAQPDTLSADQVAGWLARPGLSRSSRATYAAMLRAWFGWMQRSKRREDNPFDELPVPRAPAGEPRAADTDAIRRVLGSRLWPSTRAMILLAAYGGLRAAEIAAVRGEDIDTDTGKLWVVGKGERRASVPLHPVLAEVAQEMPSAGWWFPSPADSARHVSRTSVSAVISRAFTRAGSNATAHTLRHWYATHLLRSGASVREVQVMMRHSSLQHTARYMAVQDDRMAKSAAALPELT